MHDWIDRCLHAEYVLADGKEAASLVDLWALRVKEPELEPSLFQSARTPAHAALELL